MRTCVLSLTETGRRTGERIAEGLPSCDIYDGQLKTAEALAHLWKHYDGIICIMSAGIVVRSISQLLHDKYQDPCVLVLDPQGKHVISLLSGHLGGGNTLTEDVAAITGGTPVITTASDCLGKTPIDLWAQRNNLIVTDRKRLTQISASQINGKLVHIYSQLPLNGLPPEFKQCAEYENADMVITYKKNMTISGLCCIPNLLYLGVGCNRGTPVAEIEIAFTELCHSHGLSREAFGGMASIDLKNDETGILDFSKKLGVPLRFYSRDQLNGVEDVAVSAAVMKAVGAKGVAEPAALLFAGTGDHPAELLVKKMKWKDVTLAVAERKQLRWD